MVTGRKARSIEKFSKIRDTRSWLFSSIILYPSVSSALHTMPGFHPKIRGHTFLKSKKKTKKNEPVVYLIRYGT